MMEMEGVTLVTHKADARLPKYGLTYASCWKSSSKRWTKYIMEQVSILRAVYGEFYYANSRKIIYEDTAGITI